MLCVKYQSDSFPASNRFVGKSQKKVSKKGKGKKVIDTMAKKEWYDVRAPNHFLVRDVCKTLVSRTSGLKIASEGLKGRIFEANLGDLSKLRVEDVQGDKCITLFYGMDITRDKLGSLIKKWKTLIECNVEVSTTDGYKLRLFCIAFTRKQDNQNKKTCYAQASQIHRIRAKMVEIITEEVSKCDLATLVPKLCMESIGARIQKECNKIYPLENTLIYGEADGAARRCREEGGRGREGGGDRGSHGWIGRPSVSFSLWTHTTISEMFVGYMSE